MIDALGRNAGEPRVRDRRFRVRSSPVECASLSSANRQPAATARAREIEVDVLPRRIAVDLDRDAASPRPLRTPRPNRPSTPGRDPYMRPRGWPRM